MSSKLPQKESGIFKKIVRCYECKQYKNGLKFAKQILSNHKFSEHGETLAMKGLILNCMGRKEEAYEHVRRGLKNDIKSHVCWHVYGLVQRSDKKYEEATKCYRNALKWDKENVQILKDLSLLQIQMRDLEGFRDTRYQLLKSRPAQRGSWIGYALSYHLLEDYEMALKVMAEYRKTQTISTQQPDYEFSEMILYEVQLMQEAGRTENALCHLNEFYMQICDLLALNEARAEIFFEKGMLRESEKLYRILVRRNSNCYHYFNRLEQCLGLETSEEKLKLYEELRAEHPYSKVARVLPLMVATDDVFTSYLESYLQSELHKGVPSLFIAIKGLYKDPQKVRCLESVLNGYRDSLRSCQCFSPSGGRPGEPPSTYLWTLFLLSQHHNQLGCHSLALELINEAIDHTPTDVLLYMHKAKIYKCAGDFQEASVWMEETRSMDTADRFVNCKCVKYQLRVNDVDMAITNAGMFTREGLPPLQTMDMMQCMWFQTELGMAYHRLGRLGEALQKFHEVDKHFSDMIEDQFDFHNYCMRKMTLRAYISVLKLEDTVRSHRFYFIAAKNAIEIYLHLHANPAAAKASLNGPIEGEDEMSAAERKKIQRKQRKAQLKAQAKAQEDKKENRPHGGGKQEEEKKVEEKESKFNAKDLLAAEKPLDEAIKFLVPLQQLARNRIETHILAYRIHSHRRKFLLMLQALKRASALDPDHPELHTHTLDFLLAVESSLDGLPEAVKQVVLETLPSLTSSLTPSEFNKQFIRKHNDSLEHLIAGAQVFFRLHPEMSREAIDFVTKCSDRKSLEMCTQALHTLESGSLGECPGSVMDDYKKECHKLFPLATAFRPSATGREGGEGEGVAQTETGPAQPEQLGVNKTQLETSEAAVPMMTDLEPSAATGEVAAS